VAVEVYNANFDGSAEWLDVYGNNFSVERLDEVDVLVAGPPYQGFPALEHAISKIPGTRPSSERSR
jgi:site-specific DNA-cytosine methylase